LDNDVVDSLADLIGCSKKEVRNTLRRCNGDADAAFAELAAKYDMHE
jgi:hypothetical protein